MEVIPTGISRRRLALVAIVELVVVTAFGIAVWQVWQSRQAPAAAPAGTSQAAPSSTPTPGATPIGLPQDGTATPPAAAAGSGGETASTLLQHLQQFNGVVSSIEQAETSVLQILIPGSVWYLQHVVVPRIEAALHRG
jgi:hypothetical protein